MFFLHIHHIKVHSYNITEFTFLDQKKPLRILLFLSCSIEGEYVPVEGDEVSYKMCSIPPKYEKVQAVEVTITHLAPGTKHETWSGMVIDSWTRLPRLRAFCSLCWSGCESNGAGSRRLPWWVFFSFVFSEVSSSIISFFFFKQKQKSSLPDLLTLPGHHSVSLVLFITQFSR